MILEDIVSEKRKQLDTEKSKIKIGEMIRSIEDQSVRDFTGALRGEKISIIAEIKKASPSKGIIQEVFDHRKIAKIYERINVDAVSVLTEKNFFMGKDDYIRDVKEITRKPVLRKDFLIDEYQLYQSRFIGADAVLLILSILKENISTYLKKTKELGLHYIAEVHDREELELALDAGCTVIGINNRNLKNFVTSIKVTESLMKFIPSGITVISESGIKNVEDIKFLESLGVSAVLIGETLMRNINDAEAVENFINFAKNSREEYR